MSFISILKSIGRGIETVVGVSASVVQTATAAAEQKAKELAEQDPLKIELDKVQRKGRTKAEKLIYTKKRVDEQLKELGIEDEPLEDEDAKPMTVGDFKRMQAQTAQKTALQLADEVSNETERELLKYHLENTIRSTGNPTEDLKLAQGLVNSVKNQQILEETLRKPAPRTSGGGSGAPAREIKQEEFSEQELIYMKAPFNLTKQQILDARSGKDRFPEKK